MVCQRAETAVMCAHAIQFCVVTIVIVHTGAMSGDQAVGDKRHPGRLRPRSACSRSSMSLAAFLSAEDDVLDERRLLIELERILDEVEDRRAP